LSSTALNGQALDINNYTGSGASTWSASTTASRQWNADGSIANSGGASANNLSNAFLPFEPENDLIYTLTVDLNITGGPEWFAMGFTSTATVDTGFFSNVTGDGAPWMLVRSSGLGVARSGPGTGGALPTFPTGSPKTVSIELDTTNADWVATFTSGSETRTHTYTGLDISDDINFVSFGRFTNNDGTVDNFSLTVIPEPSAATLLGLFGMVAVLRRRRK
jgi:hypothetical protein